MPSTKRAHCSTHTHRSPNCSACMRASIAASQQQLGEALAARIGSGPELRARAYARDPGTRPLDWRAFL